MMMKRVLTAAFIAIAFTGAASADDNYSNGNNGYDNGYAAEKPAYPAKKKYAKKDIKISEDPNPSKLKQQLEFFRQFRSD